MVLNQRVDTMLTRQWRDSLDSTGATVEDKHSHTFQYTGTQGRMMLGVYETIEVGGVRFGVISELPLAEAMAPVTTLGQISLLLLILTALVVAVIAVLLTRRIVRPILALSAGADRISSGDLQQEIESSSTNEIGGLADSFNQMLRNLRSTREQTAALDWLKTGQAGLNEVTRGEQDLASLGNNIISYLAQYLDAEIGAIYLAEEGHLRMIGSYAYSQRKNLSNEFAPGEGLIGQAALEKKPILLTNCPDDYIRIQSGLGESVPHNILVFPVVKDGQTLSVIELGSFEVFGEAKQEFMQEVSPAISSILKTVNAQVQTQKLLEETQAQSRQLQTQQEELRVANEELQSQQEELKTANEELQEQTGRLRASEESLQAQQEELRVTNEELEEKNEQLENQTREVEQAREDVEEKAEALAQASKYKSQFLANMSHELRSPLNSLLLLADSLRQNKEGNLNEDQVESAGIIFDSGNDLLSLINEILDLSKIEAGRMDLNLESVALDELGDEVKAGFGHLARAKGLKLEIELTEVLPEKITTDRKRLMQILKNLVSNAIKFTEHGEIAIHFRVPEDSVRFKHSGLSVEQSLAIEVSDTGIGLAADKQKMIFEAFQQADGGTARRYGGTGLGLAISRELANLLGGEIQLESEPGKGSTFTLYLPLAMTQPEIDVETKAHFPLEKPPAPKLQIKSAAKPVVTPFADDRNQLEDDKQTLLVIEDDVNFAKILYQHARDHHFNCLVALTGEEGLELAKQHQPTAITLDLKLPGVDGWAVLGCLKDDPQTRHIPVHIISSLEGDAESLRRGAIGHLAKPATQKDLEDVFGRIEAISSQQLKRLLLVEDSRGDRKAVTELLDGMEIIIDEVESGEEAFEALRQQKYDCVILDLGLRDMDGGELLRKLNHESKVDIPPVIIYTARDLTRDEEIELREYASTIVLKNVRSQERLLDEVSLFLHSVVSDMPEQKQKIISNLHDTDSMLINRKVLVVDDDMRTMFALSKLLSSHGLVVLRAEDGAKALEVLGSAPDIELVLTDIMMPGMDGYETIEKIRAQERFRKLPIIALTAKAMAEDRERCFAVGASDYLPKPVDQTRLLSMLRVWLYR
ncbi:response regulator [Dongshaea marina]|uniref:response regulator n=1 Tax=Dongshaea marina TaxID=2047966 RepID=UPI000D3E7D9C|nr:response regulator [Dongshaea marina]